MPKRAGLETRRIDADKQEVSIQEVGRDDNGNRNYIIKSKWASLTWKGVLGMILLLICAGAVAFVLFCLGYEEGKGFYLKPIEIKKGEGK